MTRAICEELLADLNKKKFYLNKTKNENQVGGIRIKITVTQKMTGAMMVAAATVPLVQ